jgi:hypothetical protein
LESADDDHVHRVVWDHIGGLFMQKTNSESSKNGDNIVAIVVV